MLVPVKKPSSVWRTLILFFAAVLTLGVFAPAIASAHSRAFLSVHDTTVVEPRHGSTTAHVKITLNHRVHHKVSVGWFTKDGTARAGSDYVAARDRASIRAGHRVAFANVTILADRHHHDWFSRHHEHSEFFKVLLTHPHGARIADGRAIVTILEPRRVLPTLFVSDVTTDEGGVPHFRVSLSKPAVADVTFHFTTLNDSAVDTQAANQANATAADFQSRSGDKTIAKGDTSTLIGVPTFKDGVSESAEDFRLKVSNVVHATVHNSVGEATIRANSS